MGDRQSNILVSVSCLTYNHVHYLRQCLEGFLMQQGDFDFEVLIHDDASTDGTIDIIREYQEKYPEIIKPFFQQENQWSKGVRGMNQKFNFPRAKGKYIAMCEGDDYWTDPLKLQKQVDFLEAYPDFSLACGGYIKRYLNSEEEVIIDNPKAFLNSNRVGFEFDMNDLRKKWLTKTLTTIFRKDSLQIEELNKYRYARDVHLFYHLMKNGKGVYFQEVFGVYNIHEGGVHSMKSQLTLVNNSFNTYSELYKLNNDSYTHRKALAATLRKLSFDLRYIYQDNDKTSRFKLLFQACRMARSPRDILKITKVIGAYLFSRLSSFVKSLSR